MRVVINADDLGYNQERDRGIFECYGDGVITSASVLANAVFANEALHQAVQVGMEVGLHFNITEGRPLSDLCKLPTLAPTGFFHGKLEFVEEVKVNAVDPKEIALELEAQLQWFKDTCGFYPSHVDGHQHCHILPIVRDSFCATLEKYGIKWTRLPLEASSSDYSDFLKYVVSSSRESHSLFSSHGIRHATKFVGLGTMGKKMTVETLEAALLSSSHEAKGSISCELMVHPGYPCQGEGGCGIGPDEFSKSFDRHHEMSVLCSVKFKNLLERLEMRLCSRSEL